MKYIEPQGFKANGHNSPGIISCGTVYVSGQLPIDHRTGSVVKGDITEQVKVTLKNVEAVLLAAGATCNSVVQCRIYIPDIKLWEQVNGVYSEFFGNHRPARVVVPTRELHHGVLVEIEAIAEVEK